MSQFQKTHDEDITWHKFITKYRKDMSWVQLDTLLTPLPFIGNILTCGIFVLRRHPPVVDTSTLSSEELQRYKNMFQTGKCDISMKLPDELIEFGNSKASCRSAIPLFVTQACAHIYSCPYPFLEASANDDKFVPIRAPSMKRIFSFIKQRCEDEETRPFLMLIDICDKDWFADVALVALQNGVNVTYDETAHLI